MVFFLLKKYSIALNVFTSVSSIPPIVYVYVPIVNAMGLAGLEPATKAL